MSIKWSARSQALNRCWAYSQHSTWEKIIVIVIAISFLPLEVIVVAAKDSAWGVFQEPGRAGRQKENREKLGPAGDE